MNRGRALLLLACAGGVATIALACGSKTGLLLDGISYQDGESPGPPAPFAEAGPLKPLGCTPGTFTLTLAQTDVMFVLDRSGSMSMAIDGSQPLPPIKPSKWTLVQSALTPLLNNIEGTIEVGAKFFPQVLNGDPTQISPSEACGLSTQADVVPALETADAILDMFVSTGPAGGTPTADAISSAAAYLSSPNIRSVARFMVLATDGAPNCNPNVKSDPNTCVCTLPSPPPGQPTGCASDPAGGIYSCLDDVNTVQAIANAATQEKIPTFVIGLGDPGEPAFIDVLNRMAVAGTRPNAGTPQYYDVRSGDELNTAFSQIETSISKCAYVTPSAPNDPSAITILINGLPIPRDPTHQEGWDWIDEEFGEIALFGGACNPEAGAIGTITATVACDTD